MILLKLQDKYFNGDSISWVEVYRGIGGCDTLIFVHMNVGNILHFHGEMADRLLAVFDGWATDYDVVGWTSKDKQGWVSAA